MSRTNQKKSYNYNNVLCGRTEELIISPFSPGYFYLTNTLSGLKGVKGNDSTSSPPRVLDVGCGQGVNSKAIKKYRPDLGIWAIDISRASLRQAKKDSGGVKFLYGSAYKIPFKNKTFDALITSDTMEHLDSPGHAVAEFRRVLKDKGVLILSCPTEGNITTLHGLLWKVFGLNLKEKHYGHVQMFTLKELRGLLEAEGFKIVKWHWSNYLFNQIVDLSQYVALYLLGKKPHERLNKKFIQQSFTYKLGSFINFLEGKFFFFIPGQTIHITAKMKK